MRNFLKKCLISTRFIKRVLFELWLDVYFYYINTYPILLIIGAFKRIKRRLKYLWLPKGPGRPPTPENIVDIILEMKRCNPGWGKKRIRDELLFLGIYLDKNTIQKILIENGMLPPKLKFHPPTWAYLYNSKNKNSLRSDLRLCQAKLP